jgi:hypothetical protein
MIETAILLLHSLLFGIGVALTVYGAVLVYQIFFGENRFETMALVMGISFLCLSLGLGLVHYTIVA